MFSALLVIIYLSFISLGLPDALLGSAWPVMHVQIHADIADAGTIAMIISAMTVISSLNADRMIRRFTTGRVTLVSVAMTAAALFGFSCSRTFLQLCLWAVPYGLGAGAVDSALNNYVALHYESRHMSWLHCFWGVGASIGPYVMGMALTGQGSWPLGYRIIGVLQCILTAVLFFSLPLWKHSEASETGGKALGFAKAVKIPGAAKIMIAFLCYSAAETSAGLWASSYLTAYRGIEPEQAAFWASLFYLGITCGRAVSGFIADRIGDNGMIRLGQSIMFTGVLMILLPLPEIFALCGLTVFGLGCAPVYPSIIHSTPARFGRENSQALVGIQMASAYTGSTLFPKLFGLITKYFGIGLYPLFLLVLTVCLTVMTESASHRVSNS